MGSMSKDRFFFDLDAVDVSGSSVELGATTLAALENITVSATDLDIRDLAFATDAVDASGSSVSISGDITATDLDIRDLTSATDSVAIKDASGQALFIDPSGFITANINGSVAVTATDLDIRDLNAATDSVTVQASDLDIRDLAFATDKVDVTGSLVDVQATDLDIRNLDYSQDNILIKNSMGIEMFIDGSGLVGIRALAFATDSVDVSGSEVSLDAATLAALESITVNTAANTAVKETLKTATTTASLVVASALANRVKLSIQNNGDKSIFIGSSAVTALTGTEVKKGQTYLEDVGAGVALYMITATGSNAFINVLEYA